MVQAVGSPLELFAKKAFYIGQVTIKKYELNTLFMLFMLFNIIRPQYEKTCLRGFANNNGADQPVHPRRLIHAFFIRFLESIISELASSETSMF